MKSVSTPFVQGLLIGVAAAGAIFALLHVVNKGERRDTLKLVAEGENGEAKSPTSDLVSSSSHAIGHAHPHVKNQEDYMDCIYMDYNATTPVYAEVFEAMKPYLTACFGNPASSHIYGQKCAKAVVQAREQVARLINAEDSSSEVIFTSCGTESDNWAVDIALHAYHIRQPDGRNLPRVITCAVEHPAVLCYLRTLKLQGKIDLVVIGVNEEGKVSPTLLSTHLTPHTALITIMHSNNEVGTIQPIRAIARIVQDYNEQNKAKILFHSDAAQSGAKVIVDVRGMGLDMLTIVGHKYGAPKGIAVLYVKSGVPVPARLVGGGQEKGRRAGTYLCTCMFVC